jgi:hypothetical protein
MDSGVEGSAGQTRSSFCSTLNNLGTHLADFFSSPKSL